MQKLIISTEAELKAAVKNGELKYEGSIDFKLDVFDFSLSIRASGDISASRIYFKCIYAFQFKKLTCNAVVPLAGFNAREQWGARFCIDTTTGCWDEFIERLSSVAEKLLKKKHWLPVEIIMLKSVLGHYREKK